MAGVRRTLIRRMFDAAPPGSINLGLGQPDLPTPEPMRLAGIRAIEDGHTRYTSTAGDPELRAAVAATYPGHAEGADGVAITSGTQEAMFAAFLVLLDPGDEVLVPDPGYPAYATVARLVGACPVSYPLRPDRRFRLDPEDLLGRCTARTRAAVLCSPANPTGAVHRADDLSLAVDGLARRGVAWISDEVYAGFCYEGELPVPRSIRPEGGVTLGGVSKDAAMTGWRIGWAAGPTALIRPMVAAHQHLVTCASSVSQRAALAAFTPEGRAALAVLRERFVARRRRMAERLAEIPGIEWSEPDGAFYVFVRIPGCRDSEALALDLVRRSGVITIPGVAFGPGGEGWLRLSFAAAEDDIDRGVRAIGAALAAR
jgi:aspartate aminotransferase